VAKSLAGSAAPLAAGKPKASVKTRLAGLRVTKHDLMTFETKDRRKIFIFGTDEFFTFYVLHLISSSAAAAATATAAAATASTATTA
jgi:hypothetical protein